MKKIIALLLALVMTLSLFACGTQDDVPEATKGTAGDPQPSEQVNVPQEPTHIVFWVDGYTAYMEQNTTGQDAVIAAMNEYAKEKINVTFEFIYADDNDKLKLELATSDKIDMFWSGKGATFWDEMVNQGAVMDISDLLGNYPTLTESISDMVWESTEFNGRRYVIPCMKESFTGGTYIVPKALAERVKTEKGIDVSTIELDTFRDFDKLTEYLQAVVDIEESALGVVKTFTFENMMGYDTNYSVVNSGVGLDASTGKIIDLYATPEYAAYVALMYEWNQRGFFHDELAVGALQGSLMNEWRNTGNYGMTQWVTTPDNANNAASRYNGNEVYTLEFGARVTGSNSMLGSDYAISAKSENADACLKLIELILTDPVMADLYAFGIEGVNYTRNADGSVTKIENSGYVNEVWMVSSVFTCSLLDIDSPNKKELYTSDNAEAVASPTMGFRFNSENVSAEISALSNVKSEYTHLLEYGFYDPDVYLQKFLDARKASGVDNIIAEMQAQYDAWLANK